jgi:DnaJ-class molecular chaperone
LFDCLGRGRPQPKKAADTTKFYELLGVAKTADASEIKKAYRKAALQHHPDRGGDPEKFKELSKAHEVLSDPAKRELYDEGGEEALAEGAQGGGPGGMDIFDIFGGGFGGGRGGRGQRVRKGEDVIFPLVSRMRFSVALNAALPLVVRLEKRAGCSCLLRRLPCLFALYVRVNRK